MANGYGRGTSGGGMRRTPPRRNGNGNGGQQPNRMNNGTGMPRGNGQAMPRTGRPAGMRNAGVARMGAMSPNTGAGPAPNRGGWVYKNTLKPYHGVYHFAGSGYYTGKGHTDKSTEKIPASQVGKTKGTVNRRR